MTTGRRPALVDALVAAGLTDRDPGAAGQAALLLRVLNASADHITVVGRDGAVLLMNLAARRGFGISEHDADADVGTPWLSLLPRGQRRQARRALRHATSGRSTSFDSVTGADSGDRHWDNVVAPVADGSGRVVAVLCVSHETTREREAEQRLRHASETDELTELLNRRTFRLRLDQMVDRAARHGLRVGMVLIDLDHFKSVNDALGHQAGDFLLKTVGQRLAEISPPGALVGRLGGDEFAIAVSPLDDQGDDTTEALARTVVAAFRRPMSYGGRPLSGGMSIGCATFPDDAVDASTLIRHADIALSHLKLGGRGGVRTFDLSMMATVDRTARELELADRVVRCQGIVPLYQPVVNMANGAISELDVTVRWRLPGSDQLRDAGELASAFDDFELAAQISDQLHRAVIADLVRWRRIGLPPVRVTLPAVPVELLGTDYVSDLRARLESAQIPAAQIQVATSERSLEGRGSELVARALRALQEAGIGLAISDYGSGQTSLIKLRATAPRHFRLGRVLLQDLPTNPSAREGATALVVLGKSLNAAIVADGVSDAEILRVAREIGCDTALGQAVAEPVGATAVGAVLAGRNR